MHPEAHCAADRQHLPPCWPPAQPWLRSHGYCNSHQIHLGNTHTSECVCLCVRVCVVCVCVFVCYHERLTHTQTRTYVVDRNRPAVDLTTLHKLAHDVYKPETKTTKVHTNKGALAAIQVKDF